MEKTAIRCLEGLAIRAGKLTPELAEQLRALVSGQLGLETELAALRAAGEKSTLRVALAVGAAAAALGDDPEASWQECMIEARELLATWRLP